MSSGEHKHIELENLIQMNLIHKVLDLQYMSLKCIMGDAYSAMHKSVIWYPFFIHQASKKLILYHTNHVNVQYACTVYYHVPFSQQTRSISDEPKLYLIIYQLQTSQITNLMGPTWGHLGPAGPRWAPCWPHEPCYQGWSLLCSLSIYYVRSSAGAMVITKPIMIISVALAMLWSHSA